MASVTKCSICGDFHPPMFVHDCPTCGLLLCELNEEHICNDPEPKTVPNYWPPEHPTMPVPPPPPLSPAKKAAVYLRQLAAEAEHLDDADADIWQRIFSEAHRLVSLPAVLGGATLIQ